MPLNDKVKYIILFFCIIIFSGCEKSTEPVSDSISVIKGIVIDAESGDPIDSVIIGFKNPDTPDSLIFIGDSLAADLPNSIDYQTIANDGVFSFEFASSQEPPVIISDMFAYISKKRLWRFISGWDSVYQINQSIDSIAIRMFINDCYEKPEWNEITLYDHLYISFPKAYGCSEGTFISEDTRGFLKNRDDYNVSFHWQLGMTPFFPKEFTYLPSAEEYNYPFREIFFVESDSAAFYYYHPTNKRGIALIKTQDKSKFREIVFVDFSSEEFEEVMQILNTVRYK